MVDEYSAANSNEDEMMSAPTKNNIILDSSAANHLRPVITSIENEHISSFANNAVSEPETRMSQVFTRVSE